MMNDDQLKSGKIKTIEEVKTEILKIVKNSEENRTLTPFKWIHEKTGAFSNIAAQKLLRKACEEKQNLEDFLLVVDGINRKHISNWIGNGLTLDIKNFFHVFLGIEKYDRENEKISAYEINHYCNNEVKSKESLEFELKLAKENPSAYFEKFHAEGSLRVYLNVTINLEQNKKVYREFADEKKYDNWLEAVQGKTVQVSLDKIHDFVNGALLPRKKAEKKYILELSIPKKYIIDKTDYQKKFVTIGTNLYIDVKNLEKSFLYKVYDQNKPNLFKAFDQNLLSQEMVTIGYALVDADCDPENYGKAIEANNGIIYRHDPYLDPALDMNKLQQLKDKKVLGICVPKPAIDLQYVQMNMELEDFKVKPGIEKQHIFYDSKKSPIRAVITNESFELSSLPFNIEQKNSKEESAKESYSP